MTAFGPKADLGRFGGDVHLLGVDQTFPWPTATSPFDPKRSLPSGLRDLINRHLIGDAAQGRSSRHQLELIGLQQFGRATGMRRHGAKARAGRFRPPTATLKRACDSGCARGSVSRFQAQSAEPSFSDACSQYRPGVEATRFQRASDHDTGPSTANGRCS